MKTASTTTTTPATTQAEPAPRLVNIADLVWYGVAPRRPGNGYAAVPLPAIVVRVEEPDNPESPVVLQAFGTAASSLQVSTKPYSADLAIDCWTWPAPAPAPEPRF